MSATYRWRKDRREWELSVVFNRARKRIRVDSEQTAKELVKYVVKLELSGVNVLEALAQARAPQAPAPPMLPPLREAVPAWLDRQVQADQIRSSTARLYARHLRGWCYPHRLEDGRELGDVPIDAVTREELGAVIRRIREAKRSLSVVDAVRCALKGFFGDLIETKVLPGPNPAGDLKHFVGKASRKGQKSHYPFFTPDEGPVLLAAARAFCPRWQPFIMTGLLAGLRWGEAAALRRTDVNLRRGTITLERTVSDRGAHWRIEPVKDYQFRTVKASPKLVAALQAHMEAMTLEGQVKEWDATARALVFPTAAGQLLPYPHFYQSIWRPLVRQSGLPYRKYHATRHTYATWLLEDGADIRWVSRQMGHATIKQTIDTYGHVQPERHEAATHALDGYI